MLCLSSNKFTIHCKVIFKHRKRCNFPVVITMNFCEQDGRMCLLVGCDGTCSYKSYLLVSMVASYLIRCDGNIVWQLNAKVIICIAGGRLVTLTVAWWKGIVFKFNGPSCLLDPTLLFVGGAIVSDPRIRFSREKQEYVDLCCADYDLEMDRTVYFNTNCGLDLLYFGFDPIVYYILYYIIYSVLLGFNYRDIF